MNMSLADLVGLSIGTAVAVILFVAMMYRELQENRNNRAYFEYIEEQNNLITLIRNAHEPKVLTPGVHEIVEEK